MQEALLAFDSGLRVVQFVNDVVFLNQSLIYVYYLRHSGITQLPIAATIQVSDVTSNECIAGNG